LENAYLNNKERDMRKIWFVVFILGNSLYGMEEVVIEDQAFDTFASILSQMLLGVIFIAPAVTVGSLFALMRFDKELKTFLSSEQVGLSGKIDNLREQCLDISYNEKVLDLNAKREQLKQELERII
jgi:hypothetical protein